MCRELYLLTTVVHAVAEHCSCSPHIQGISKCEVMGSEQFIDVHTFEYLMEGDSMTWSLEVTR